MAGKVVVTICYPHHNDRIHVLDGSAAPAFHLPVFGMVDPPTATVMVHVEDLDGNLVSEARPCERLWKDLCKVRHDWITTHLSLPAKKPLRIVAIGTKPGYQTGRDECDLFCKELRSAGFGDLTITYPTANFPQSNGVAYGDVQPRPPQSMMVVGWIQKGGFTFFYGSYQTPTNPVDGHYWEFLFGTITPDSTGAYSITVQARDMGTGAILSQTVTGISVP